MGLIDMDKTKEIIPEITKVTTQTQRDPGIAIFSSINESLKLLKDISSEFGASIREVGIIRGGRDNERDIKPAQIITKELKSSPDNNQADKKPEGAEVKTMDIDKIIKGIGLVIKLKGDLKLSETKKYLEDNKEDLKGLIS